MASTFGSKSKSFITMSIPPQDEPMTNRPALLGIMEYKVDALMMDAISLVGRNDDVFRITSNEMHQLPPKPSRQEEFEHIVTNFIFDQEERVKQLEEYMEVIKNDFMQLSSEVIRRLKEKKRENENKIRKNVKITRYPDTKDYKPFTGHKPSKNLAKKTSSSTPKFTPMNSLRIGYVHPTLWSPPRFRKSTFGFKPGKRVDQTV
ncbi:hypothetical protein Tco_0658315 [Tanacetum coccineum]